MICPHCKRKLLQVSAADQRVRLRTPVVILEQGKVSIVCRHCNAEVPLAATPRPELDLAVQTASQGPRLVVPKGA